MPEARALTLREQAVRLESQLNIMRDQISGLARWAGDVRRQLEEIEAEVDAMDEVAAAAYGNGSAWDDEHRPYRPND